MIAVVDYGAGNIRSVELALGHLNASFETTSDPARVLAADRVIFPGVGAAGSAMRVLKERGLDEALGEAAKRGTQILGICIGAQLVLDHSEEGDTTCLGLIKGNVRRFPSDAGLKIPQIGWNTVEFQAESGLFTRIPDSSSFYFVHSYYPAPADAWALGRTSYGVEFVCAFEQENVHAVQFHPEKSGPVGLRLLQNFFSLD
jgi:glutamine amidotransferase